MDPMVVPASLDALHSIGQYVLQAAVTAGLAQGRAYRLRLAVDEIATNIIEYGYGESNPAKSLPAESLTIRADLTAAALTITLEDTSPAFDPRTHEADADSMVAQPAEERAIGGLGIHLTLQGVDQFDYQTVDGCNRSIFVMYRDPVSKPGES